jgi:hypothetical protein
MNQITDYLWKNCLSLFEVLVSIYKCLGLCIIKIKNWLKEDGLSCIAIIFSFFALLGSSYAVYLTDRQTKISESQNLPFFEVKKATEVLPHDKSWIEKIEIHDSENKFRHLKDDIAIFLVVKGSVVDNPAESIQFRLPLKNYYISGGEIKHGENPVSTISNMGQNHLLMRNINIFNQECKKEGISGKYELIEYIKIKYEDKLGNSHTEYFKIEKYNRTSKIDNVVGQEIFDNYYKELEKKEMNEPDKYDPKELVLRLKTELNRKKSIND